MCVCGQGRRGPWRWGLAGWVPPSPQAGPGPRAVARGGDVSGWGTELLMAGCRGAGGGWEGAGSGMAREMQRPVLQLMLAKGEAFVSGKSQAWNSSQSGGSQKVFALEGKGIFWLKFRWNLLLRVTYLGRWWGGRYRGRIGGNRKAEIHAWRWNSLAAWSHLHHLIFLSWFSYLQRIIINNCFIHFIERLGCKWSNNYISALKTKDLWKYKVGFACSSYHCWDLFIHFLNKHLLSGP